MSDQQLYLASSNGTSYELRQKSEVFKSWRNGELPDERLVWCDESQGWKTLSEFFATIKNTAKLSFAKLTSALKITGTTPAPAHTRKKRTLKVATPPPSTTQRAENASASPQARKNLVAAKTSHKSFPWMLLLYLPAGALLLFVALAELYILPGAEKSIKRTTGHEVAISGHNLIDYRQISFNLDKTSLTTEQFPAFLQELAQAQTKIPLTPFPFSSVTLNRLDKALVINPKTWVMLAEENDSSRLIRWIGQGTFHPDGTSIYEDVGKNEISSYNFVHNVLFPDLYTPEKRIP